MKYFSFALVVAAFAMLAALPAAQAADPQYIGVDACGKCHKKDKQGEQLKLWQESEHAKAYKDLGTAEAKKRAEKVGVSGDPQKAEACLVCHTTGYGQPASAFQNKFDMKDGVQCESCHGAGSEYKKKKIMKAIFEESGRDNKGDSPTAKKTGLVFPDENTCKQCHVPETTFNGKTYKNPSYKDFDYKERLDKIKHPVP